MQFKNGNRRVMRLVIWKKHDPTVIKRVIPFTAIDDNVQILQFALSMAILKRCLKCTID